MKRISVVLFVAFMAGGIGFAGGAWNAERMIKYHCVNDPSFSVIDGDEFACINKAQFIGRYLQGGHGNGNT